MLQALAEHKAYTKLATQGMVLADCMKFRRPQSFQGHRNRIHRANESPDTASRVATHESNWTMQTQWQEDQVDFGLGHAGQSCVQRMDSCCHQEAFSKAKSANHVTIRQEGL